MSWLVHLLWRVLRPRVLVFLVLCLFIRLLFISGASNLSTSTNSASKYLEIREHNVLERVTRSEKTLNPQKHKFLQVRMGRDERRDMFSDIIQNGVDDFWERFQKPYILGRETAHRDAQSVLSAIDLLLSLNGWVAALCPTLTRPFGQNHFEDAYDDLSRDGHLFFVSIVIHSADHFLVDQLAVIVQMAKRLGPSNLFVSMLDYTSSDSTETLTDLCEAVLILLGVPFRIRRVPGMTTDPAAAYYPLEEAHMRNLALEPLLELKRKRNIKFHRVIWLKGFTCPNDILETIKVSIANDAAMVCGMDWAEYHGSFIFSDRWRTRDINGDQFRQARSSSSKSDAVPPRDRKAAARYAQHLPFQVFCCEAGTHVVDPAQSYYKGIAYRSGPDFHNTSSHDPVPQRNLDASCLDSSQSWFCRDLWINKAKESTQEQSTLNLNVRQKRDESDAELPIVREDPNAFALRQAHQVDADANAGSDYDAMSDSDVPLAEVSPKLSIPNSVFRPARIMVNPRCVTTYAGVSHTQLAQDLFGTENDDAVPQGKYVLDDWEGAPESFVCQEQRSTGGREAIKTQRRLGFSIHDELERFSS